MRAVQIARFGGPEVLELVDLPTPTPGPGQVLVQVGAAGVNFAETLIRENRYAVTPTLPAVLGTEVAGVVRDPRARGARARRRHPGGGTPVRGRRPSRRLRGTTC